MITTEEKQGMHNSWLYPAVDAMQTAGDLGSSALKISLVPSTAAVEIAQSWFKLWGVDSQVLETTRRALGATEEIVDQIVQEPPTPEFNIGTTTINGEVVPVKETYVFKRAFSKLKRFDRIFSDETKKVNQPNVLVVAAMSGHDDTLHRPTVRAMLADANVHMLGWNNAADVNISEGSFGADEYIDDVKESIKTIGSNTHVIAVCQPVVYVSAALASIAEETPEFLPTSVTLISGPVDTSVNREASKIDGFVKKNDIESLSRKMIGVVPAGYEGAGREVWLGKIQRALFYGAAPQDHAIKYWHQFLDRTLGDDERADNSREFYEEYNHVIDIHGRFYRETYQKIFEEQQLANGTFEYRGKRIDMSLVKDIYLTTVEGSKDAFCPPGQTFAAHAIYSSLSPEQRSHILVPAGHYGTWAGRHFIGQVLPQLRRLFIDSAKARGIEYDEPTLPVHSRNTWASLN